MNIRTCSIFLLSLFIFCNAAFAVTDTNEILKNAVSTDEAATDAAIKSLREMRQDGLNALLAKYQNEIDHYKKTGERSAEWQRIARAIDRVAMQKDAYASGLYWYTDLNEAKTYAQKSNKPILSLRLLGQLSEEYSCANSRFFRSILYSNSKIASYLRENYVLHWKSVRPAPKVTIDFGDGRKIVRTITGNSIHYILNSEGKIIDALPGLYSPNEFIVYLARVNSLQNRFSPNIRSYQTNQLDWLTRKWNADSMKIGLKTEDLETPASAKPTALEAAPRAVTKSVVESPLVRSITIEAEAPADIPTSNTWERLVGSFRSPEFDRNSEDFIRLKTGANEKLTDEQFAKLIVNLKKYVAIDTVQNEYLFHAKIYRWLLEDSDRGVDEFNDAVYDKLFLTPGTDKWLGLYSPDIYSAIENNGVVK